ncbi:family 1 glycosylhydrolase [Glutamicibacter sp. NPDC087344]|uniref:family 1 glycosylhydrolase n=1 Tax=Glutamicibacter sp. NPDC087344 TaxID=3363994 RepID=UPI00380AE527
MSHYPDNFLWGVATAGHQNEGNNKHSDIWFLENVQPTLFSEPSGRACEAYDRYESDLDQVAQLGLNAFRFSIEWARIEPERGTVISKELDHYEAVVDAALERGLAPLATFNHFAAPHWFSAAGSWLAKDSAQLFAEQVDRVMQRVGDRLTAAVTINEPNLEQLLQAGGKLPPEAETIKRQMLQAAAQAAGTDTYYASNVIPSNVQGEFQEAFTVAHRMAKSAIKAQRSDLPVGISIAIGDDRAVPGGEARRDARRAAVYDHWLEVARDDDFIGVQNYESFLHGPDGEIQQEGLLNGMGSAVDPTALAGAVRYAHEVSGVPVLVTEHGIQIDDDKIRAEFIPQSLAALEQQIAAGTPVLGYCHWTLMDNFEWIFGYGPKLGLLEVDRQTLERTPKPSAKAYAQVVAQARAVAVAQG